MEATPATPSMSSRWARSPSASSSARRRPLPHPPNRVQPPPMPGPTEPLPVKVPTPAPPPPPLQVAPSHTNALFGGFVGGFRRLWRPVARRSSSHHSAAQAPLADVENAAGFSGVPFPEQAPDYVEPGAGPVTVHVAHDGHTFVPDDGPRSPELLAPPGTYTPSMIMSPSSLAGPTSNLAPSRHTSRAPSMHAPSLRVELADPLPPGTHSGYHSRTSSMARNNNELERHSSRQAGDSDSDDDGDGEVATAVGHGADGMSVLPPHSQTAPSATPYARPHFINGTTDPRSTAEDADSMGKAPPARSPYGSTFAAIAGALRHVRALPWVSQIVAAEWTPPNKRVGPPTQSQSWYTPGPRSGVFPGPPSGYPPEMMLSGYALPPLTTTMNLSAGMMQPPPQAYSMSPDGSPWPPGTQYYYNPQYQPQPFVSPAPPPPAAHPHMPSMTSPQSQMLSPNDVPSLLLRQSGLQQPLSSQSMYPNSQSVYPNSQSVYPNRSAASLPRRSRAPSTAYGHAQ